MAYTLKHNGRGIIYFMRQDWSPQEISDYLDGLNRVTQAWVATGDTARLRARAMQNYFEWFRARGIEIHEDEKSQTWKLGPASCTEDRRKIKRVL
jgi:hypothetical protein